MSFFNDDDPQDLDAETAAPAPSEEPAPAPSVMDQSASTAPRPTSERAVEVNNTQRTFDPNVADFTDTERAKRLYAERGETPPTH